MSQAVFVGHSLTGGELSRLGSVYPEIVEKLVYLDAYDYYGRFKIGNEPGPIFTDADLSSLEKFQAAQARLNGILRPNASLCNTLEFDSSGKITGNNEPDYVGPQIKAGLTGPADYPEIRAPRLGIFASFYIDLRQPWYWYLDTATQIEFDQAWPPIVAWQQDALDRFRGYGPNSPAPTVFTLPLPQSNPLDPTAGAYHYIFINNEAFVVKEMRQFFGISLSTSGLMGVDPLAEPEE
jgi:hypothetical protein